MTPRGRRHRQFRGAAGPQESEKDNPDPCRGGIRHRPSLDSSGGGLFATVGFSLKGEQADDPERTQQDGMPLPDTGSESWSAAQIHGNGPRSAAVGEKGAAPTNHRGHARILRK